MNIHIVRTPKHLWQIALMSAEAEEVLGWRKSHTIVWYGKYKAKVSKTEKTITISVSEIG